MTRHYSNIWQKKAWIKYEKTAKNSVEIFLPSAHITKECESEAKVSFRLLFKDAAFPSTRVLMKSESMAWTRSWHANSSTRKILLSKNWRLWGIRIDNSLWRFPLPLLLCSCGAFSVEISKLASKLRHAFDFGLLKTSVEFRFSHFAEELCVPFCRVQLRDPPVPPGGRWPADAARRAAKVQAHADAGRGLLREPVHDGWG